MTPELLTLKKREFFLERLRAARMTRGEAERYLQELDEQAVELLRLREVFRTRPAPQGADAPDAAFCC